VVSVELSPIVRQAVSLSLCISVPLLVARDRLTARRTNLDMQSTKFKAQSSEVIHLRLKEPVDLRATRRRVANCRR